MSATPIPTSALAPAGQQSASLARTLTGPRATALDLARQLPVPQILAEFGSVPPGDRAGILALLPVEKVPAVLLQDPRVFTVPMSRLDQPPGDRSRGIVTPLSLAEADHLREAGLGTWLVPTEWDPMGDKAIAWGLLRFVGSFSAADALERLDAILESENDPEWKLGALQSMPEAYWALALRETASIDEDDPESRLMAMEAINPDYATAVRTSMERYGREELYLRVMEAREERLPLLQMEGAPVLSEESVDALARMGERRSAADILAEIRSRKP